MEEVNKQLSKKVELSEHAKFRGRQIDLSEEDLLLNLKYARRERNFKFKRNGYRYYRLGSLIYVAEIVEDKLIIVTVYDEQKVRNPYENRYSR